MGRFSSRGAAVLPVLGLLLAATSCGGAASLAGLPGAAASGPDGLWIANLETGTIMAVI